MGKLINTMAQKNIVSRLNAHFDESNSDDYLKAQIKDLIQKEDYKTLLKLKCRHTVLKSLSFEELLKCKFYLNAMDIYDYARIHNLDKEKIMVLSQIIIAMGDPTYIYQFIDLNNAPIDMLVYGLIKTEDLKHLRLLLRADILPKEMLSMIVDEIHRIEQKINSRHSSNN